MRILVLGKNGREHALVWKISQSPLVTALYCSPGNPGTAQDAVNVPCDILDPHAVVALTKKLDIDLLVIGPEDPLAAGVADAVKQHHPSCAVFGPTCAGARLEWSKAYSKGFMKKYGIPTAEYTTFTDRAAAIAYLRECPLPIVVKADGLAAGKGVVIAYTCDEAVSAVAHLPAEQSLVVEEFLVGREVSVFAITDGYIYHVLEAAEDHKQLHDGDTGPNTGGMGAYSPVDYMTLELSTVVRQILDRTLFGLKQENAEYRGMIYLGLMVTASGVKLLEYNARFGDPECQVLMSRLDSDIVPYLLGAATSQLPLAPLVWSNDAVALVVACGGEYPAQGSKGATINGLEQAQARGCIVFHAGTALAEGQLVTNGGRILNVVGKRPNLDGALRLAYQGMKEISFADMRYRTDIGQRKGSHL
ncbi:MAG: phosphoribosylamine--glycine ligase [Peptococcaceae bacterium]|nr:phosphoribosylamine--glycine ligase [Peptococcaceae bacterium]